jgi:hypothetical protein
LLNVTNTANVSGINFGNQSNAAPMVGDQDFAIDENTSDGTVVGTVTATDPDAGQSLTFEIFSGSGEDLFAIDSETGEITVAAGANLDFEAAASYTLDVRVSDDASIPASATARMTINLTDVNEPPTAIFLSESAISEALDVSGGRVKVADLSADDPDAGATVTFVLVGLDNDNGLFEIQGTELFVRQGAGLDHETTGVLTIRVEAGDDSEAFQQDLIINVTDADEAATTVTLNPDTVPEDADTSVPVAIGDLATDDPDLSASYSFELDAGVADNDLFQISGGQLVLKAGVVLDYEARPGYTVRVRATDGAASLESDVAVEVLDVNEPPQVEDQSFALGENSMVGSAVGVVEASDPEGQSLTFAIVGGSGAAVFAIDPGMGAITVADSGALDFEAVAGGQFDVTVQVTDTGDPARSAQATITIQLDDVNEAPTDIELSNNTATGPGPSTVGELSVVDPDDPETFSEYTFELVAGAGDTDNASFQIVSGNELQFVTGSGKETYTIRVRASDGVHALSKSFEIQVMNQPPVADDHDITTGVNQSVEIDVVALGLAHDPDGAIVPSTVTIVTPPAHGAAEVLGGVITYTPAPGYSGPDDFQYTVEDNQGAVSNPGLVTIDVQDNMPWHNTDTPEDVDGDDEVTILDLLRVVQFLRERHVGFELNELPGEGDDRVDVNPDGFCDIQDVLMIVQYLRDPPPAGEPEGEAPALWLVDDDVDRWEEVLSEVADDVSHAQG